jgi:hypothetical protein
MKKNIFAHTDPGCNYPQYVSVNREESGEVSLTVRSAAWGDGTCGDTATVVLPPDVLLRLAQDLLKSLEDQG